ncbi:MAG: Maltodextrin ABC transporter, permease protein MdxG, partial [uncultured Rubrobacteraceae bacterium]
GCFGGRGQRGQGERPGCHGCCGLRQGGFRRGQDAEQRLVLRVPRCVRTGERLPAAMGLQDEHRPEGGGYRYAADDPAAELQRGVLLDHLQRRELPEGAAQQRHHRGGHHDHMPVLRGDSRLRHSAAQVQLQEPGDDPDTRDQLLPGRGDHRPAVHTVSGPGHHQHLLVGHHNGYGLRAAADDLDPGLVLQGTAAGPGGGGEDRWGYDAPGLQEGDRAAGGARRVHHGDPDVHLRVERVPFRRHVPVRRGGAAGHGQDPELRDGLHCQLRGTGRGRCRRHGAAGDTRPDLPAEDRLRPDRRRRQGL